LDVELDSEDEITTKVNKKDHALNTMLEPKGKKPEEEIK